MKSYDAAVVEMLRSDPKMPGKYLRAAFDEMGEEGGDTAFLMALRHVVQAQGGMSEIAKKANISRGSLYQALSPEGNPTLRIITAVMKATGV